MTAKVEVHMLADELAEIHCFAKQLVPIFDLLAHLNR